MARTNRHGDAGAADRRGVNPGNAERNGRVVHQESRFEVVGSVENDRKAREEIGGVLWSEIGNNSFDRDI